jgi:ent-kaurene synthase
LSHVAASTFQDRQHKYLKDTKSILELYKASEIILSENEYILENIGCWSGILLKEKLCLEGIHNIPSFAEVLNIKLKTQFSLLPVTVYV